MTRRDLSTDATDTLEQRREMTRTMLRLVRGMRAIFNAQAQEMGLTYARAHTILAVSRDEGLSQTSLADVLDIETPTLHRTLEGLEKLGFLERRLDPNDKRVRQVFLTDHARKNADQIESFTNDLRARLYDGLDPDALKTALDVLHAMDQNLDDMRR
jgi:MarR family transcriptional regulator for hemolysin